MKHLVEYPLQGGGSINVEVDEIVPEGGIVPVARPGEIAVKASETLEEALSKIKPAAQSIITQLRSLHDVPDEVCVEFGIKLNAAVGALLASAGVEANYKVTLKWTKK